MNLESITKSKLSLELCFEHDSWFSKKRISWPGLQDSVAGPEFVLRCLVKEAARDFIYARDGQVTEKNSEEVASAVEACIKEMKRDHPELFGLPA